jgi:hypothetical protein
VKKIWRISDWNKTKTAFQKEREREKEKNEINSSKYNRRNNGRGASKEEEEDRRRVHVFFCGGGGRYISIYPCFHDPSSPFIYNYTLVLLFLTGGRGGGSRSVEEKIWRILLLLLLFYFIRENAMNIRQTTSSITGGEKTLLAPTPCELSQKKRKKFLFLLLDLSSNKVSHNFNFLLKKLQKISYSFST